MQKVDAWDFRDHTWQIEWGVLVPLPPLPSTFLGRERWAELAAGKKRRRGTVARWPLEGAVPRASGETPLSWPFPDAAAYGTPLPSPDPAPHHVLWTDSGPLPSTSRGPSTLSLSPRPSLLTPKPLLVTSLSQFTRDVSSVMYQEIPGSQANGESWSLRHQCPRDVSSCGGGRKAFLDHERGSRNSANYSPLFESHSCLQGFAKSHGREMQLCLITT